MSGLPESALLVLREWIQKADSDWRASEYLLTMGQDCPYEAVCFHAQQCVEKYIKALLICHSIAFPKVHDLAKLVGLLPIGKDVPLTVIEQAKLTDYAMVDRYPGDREPITRAEAEEAVSVAHKVREAVRALLSREALDN